MIRLYKNTILFILLLTSLYGVANAGVSITSFQIPDPYINAQGKVTGNANSATTFQAKFMIGKAGITYNTVRVSLILSDSNGGRRIISQSLDRPDIQWGNSFSWDGTITGTLPAGTLSGQIYLQMETWEGAVKGALVLSTVSYYVGNGLPNPGTGIPGPLPDTEYNKRYIPLGSSSKSFSNATGTTTIARNGFYRVDWQADGNMVLYGGTNALWASKTTGGAGILSFLTAGGVTITYENGSRGWSAGTSATPNPIWVLHDDGNFVGYSDYTVNSEGQVTLTGYTFGATMTQGGRKSNRSGSLK